MGDDKKDSLSVKLNFWNRITDFFLRHVSDDKIEEIIELRVGRSDPNLFQNLFVQKRTNLDFLKVWRYLFTKVLLSKFAIAFYLYNKGLKYFFDHRLMMPQSVAEPFGETVGNILRNPNNQLGLYILYGGWLAVAVQLLVTAIAWDFK